MLVAAAGAADAEPRESPSTEYRVALDPRVGIESGTLAFTTAARLLLRGGEALLERIEPALTPATSVVARIAAGLLVDAPIAIAGVVLPHEIFGHGGRARDAGFDVTYDLNLPPPYGWVFGGAVGNSATWQTPDDQVAPTLDETALYFLGGLEVQNLQQHHLALSAFRSRSLRRGDALLYLTASIEVTAYAARPTGDIEGYYDHLETRYLANRSTEQRRTRASALVAAADPLFVASLYTYFVRYLASGDHAIRYPVLEVGEVALSLTEGMRLVPWGREHELTILVGTPFVNGASTFAVGEGPGGSSFAWTLRTADVSLGAGLFASSRLHLARQPLLSVIDRDEPLPTSGMFGGPRRRTAFAGDATVEYRHGVWVLGGTLGWKTAGYVPGTSIRADWTGALTLATRL